MLHVQFDGRFREREIGRPELELPCLGDLLAEELQQAEQGLEIDLLAQHDAFHLVEIRGMGRVDRIVAEAAGDGKILSRDLRA